ncbi:galactokinase [Oceanirhabdus seepicola]|uniref:Galactokinase n=1 Tax=Oceanirhabdus seepicola TaxID=2828781 RepID=A0A9J6P7G8_9CLOT|nr:galactokinase [Oceanirhabdus seepicola]MCM1991921.1 galactokinase [Oceanirhabdus seepicola]
MTLLKRLTNEFSKTFGKAYGSRIFFAPGRVNLIGEHTDYNGGHVLPCALSFGTYVVTRKRDDDTVRVYSKNLSDVGVIEFTLNKLVYTKEHDWANYPKGVIKTFIDSGYNMEHGVDMFFYGNIPNAAGLSSSASVEIVTSVAINKIFNFNMDMISLVKLSQKAENEFIGVNCGIMDQFASGMGKLGKAVLLDCNTLQYEYTTLQLDDASIVIANTNKKRGLAESKYNQRIEECNRALIQLKEKLNIKSLGELTEEQFENNKHLILNNIDRNRAKHAVYENRRTIRAVKALENNKIKDFGKFMKESHESLRDDYEVTGEELDTLAELAWNYEGTLGARMTGAGFGGCTVNIVENNKIDEFIDVVGRGYKESIGYEATFYVVSIGDGAREVDINHETYEYEQ